LRGDGTVSHPHPQRPRDARPDCRSWSGSTPIGEHGYVPQTQSGDRGHIHIGRLLATGGLSVLAGEAGVRSRGALTVTFAKRATPPDKTLSDPMDQLRRLGELRDAGILTSEEFESKKA
jgi:hypothetical protein